MILLYEFMDSDDKGLVENERTLETVGSLSEAGRNFAHWMICRVRMIRQEQKCGEVPSYWKLREAISSKSRKSRVRPASYSLNDSGIRFTKGLPRLIPGRVHTFRT